MEIGFTLDRYLTMQRLTRSAANMLFRGVDFSGGPNLTLLLSSAPDLDASSGGDTVIYLARIDNSGFGPEVTSRTEIGNPSIHPNTIGAPEGSGDVDPPVPATLPNGGPLRPPTKPLLRRSRSAISPSTRMRTLSLATTPLSSRTLRLRAGTRPTARPLPSPRRHSCLLQAARCGLPARWCIPDRRG